MTFFNELTPEQLERLALLLEELGEAQHIIGKIIRHGYDSHHPDNPKITNRMMLEEEIGHVQNAVGMLTEGCDLDNKAIIIHKKAKSRSISKYLHKAQQAWWDAQNACPDRLAEDLDGPICDNEENRSANAWCDPTYCPRAYF